MDLHSREGNHKIIGEFIGISLILTLAIVLVLLITGMAQTTTKFEAYFEKYGGGTTSSELAIYCKGDGDNYRLITTDESHSGSKSFHNNLFLTSKPDSKQADPYAVKVYSMDEFIALAEDTSKSDIPSRLHIVVTDKGMNQPPIANSGGPYNGKEGSSITFNASSSFDLDGFPLMYRFDFDNDSTWDTDWSYQPTASYTYGHEWNGEVGLEVNDGIATSSGSASVIIKNAAPAATIESVVKPNLNFILPLVHILKFTGSFTDEGWIDNHTSSWDFGDDVVRNGTFAEEHDSPDSSGTSEIEYAYSTPGEYTVIFTVKDDQGDIGTDTATLNVLNTTAALDLLNDYIQGLPTNALNGRAERRKKAVSKSLIRIGNLIVSRQYRDAIRKLEYDVRVKADGGLRNDWVTDPFAQESIRYMCDDLMDYVKKLQHSDNTRSAFLDNSSRKRLF